MELSDEVKDRAAGVLLGQAVGDALGVPYEFAAPIRAGQAEMIGGGLGPYEPGEWSDDTQMALCIARVAAAADLTGPDALDEVAAAFIDWRFHGASDIGNQTATALGRARHDDGTRLWERMTAIATDLAAGGSAGNGGLMRTSVVGLAALGSADRTAEAARLVCNLTHAEQRCVESSVLWSLAVRNAVLTGEADVRCGLEHLTPERRDWWTERIEEAETRPPSVFTPNGYTVTAFQAAWASIHATRDADDRVTAALQLAISIGNDTDTVAAIAGGLLGAACGASKIPGGLVEKVHGWPGLDAKDLVGLGQAIAARPSGPGAV
jgi:ADP-ribosylglycohydrolase